MNSHIEGCINAVSETCSNRKLRLRKAYSKKNGRVLASLGVLKTAAAVIGYGLYAGLPVGLRNYEVYDGFDECLDSGALPEYES